MPQPEPDTKDWTYVASDGCEECGFSAGFDRQGLPARIRANGGAWREVLAGPDVDARPAATVWSPLEYGCHVRDVLELYAYRLDLMLTEDDPLYPNWDQDATAITARYAEQDPAAVARELVSAADVIASNFEVLHESDWERTGRRSDGKSFTVDRFGRYFLHDIEHHLWDVRAA